MLQVRNPPAANPVLPWQAEQSPVIGAMWVTAPPAEFCVVVTIFVALLFRKLPAVAPWQVEHCAVLTAPCSVAKFDVQFWNPPTANPVAVWQTLHSPCGAASVAICVTEPCVTIVAPGKVLPAAWQVEQVWGIFTGPWVVEFIVHVANDAAWELWQTSHWTPATVGMWPPIWPVAIVPLWQVLHVPAAGTGWGPVPAT
jgi:hypothetical protein